MAPTVNHKSGRSRTKKKIVPQEELGSLLKKVSFSKDTDAQELLQSSKRVYSYLDAHFLNKDNETIPSLGVLIYAVRDILFPTFLGPTRINDILDLVTNIEHFRLVYMQKLDDAIVFHDFYSMRQPEVALLTQEELNRLQKMKTEGSSLRSRFLSLVLGYCQLDIHHLFTTPSLMTDAEERIERYLRDNPLPLSQTLSKGEQEQLREIIEETLRDSMKLVKAYAEKKSTGLNGDEVAHVLSCPVVIERLVDATESYLQDIEKQIVGLKEIFPT